MRDLIDRQAAIDALGERPMVWSNEDEYALGERSQYDIDRLAIETVPSAQPERKWIPCDVRMPEEHDSIFAKFKGTDRWRKIMWEKQSEKVLVTVEYEDGTRAVEVANTFDGKWKYETAVVDRYPVAWCHFPEPFREEGEQNV